MSHELGLFKKTFLVILLSCEILCFQQVQAQNETGRWFVQHTTGISPEERHESSFVELGGKFYLIGGRGTKRIQAYDPKTNTWSNTNTFTEDIHHFQPVVYQSKIYIIGAFQGNFPNENPLTNILIYDPQTDQLLTGPAIPVNRLRGSAGVVLYQGKFYVISGNRKGHRAFTDDGEAAHVQWFDSFDPETGIWEVLPDAPRARDHFQAAVIGTKLYLAGGRRSGYDTPNGTFKDTEAQVDIFDFKQGSWQNNTLPDSIPTQRAGASVAVFGGELMVIGGETENKNTVSLPKTEILDTYTGKWRTLSKLNTGRHATQAIVYKGDVFLAAGSQSKGVNEITASENFLEIFSFDGAPGVSSSSNWTVANRLTFPRGESPCVVYENEMYFFPGFGPNIKVEHTCEKYNPYTNRLTLLKPMPLLADGTPSSVTHSGIALVQDTVWVVGGRIGDVGLVSDQVWWYVISQNEWFQGSGLPMPVGGGGLGLLGRKLHYVGGFDDKAKCDLNVHLVYDLDKPSLGWQDITATAPMPEARNHFGTAVLDGKLYAIGGQHGHDAGCNHLKESALDVDDVHVYDPFTNQWSRLADYPHTESHTEPSTFTLDGKIYVMGGQILGNTAFVYDPTLNSWTELPNFNLSVGLLAPGARIFEETYVVVGGGAPTAYTPSDMIRTKRFPRTPINSLSFNPKHLLVELTGSETKKIKVILSATNAKPRYVITSTDLPSWLSLNKKQGEVYESSEDIELTFNEPMLPAGTYTFQLRASADTYTDAILHITLNKDGGEAIYPVLKELALLDASSGERIRSLGYLSDLIYLDQLPDSLSIEAIPENLIGSVAFEINGVEVKVENLDPFTLSGEQKGIPIAYPFTPGVYFIKVTPYSGSNKTGILGAEITLNLKIEAQELIKDLSIQELRLIAADTKETIRVLKNASDTLYLNQLPTNLTLEAIVGSDTKSIEFLINGALARVEGNPPYSLTNESPTSFIPYPFKEGIYEIRTTAFSGAKRTGQAGTPYTLNLTVIDTLPPSSELLIKELVLVNATNAQPIRSLRAGSGYDSIILDQNPSQLSIEAKVGSQVKSVQFQINQETPRTENTAPYSLLGDKTTSFTPFPFEPGIYVIKATPYSGISRTGIKGNPLIINLTVRATSPSSMYQSFINADNDRVVLSPIPNNSQININNIGTFTIEPKNIPDSTGSIVFKIIEGPEQGYKKVENILPFTLFGDKKGDYLGIPTQAGDSYTITVEAYDQKSGKGNLIQQSTISFTFTDIQTVETDTNQEFISPWKHIKNIYPNIITDSEVLHVVVSKDAESKLLYQVVNQYGSIILSKEQTVCEGCEDIVLDINTGLLQPGLYYLSMESDRGEKRLVRIIKN